MTRFLTAHPTAANLLMLLFLVAGLTALPSLQRSSLPDMPIVNVEVSIAYPGASTHEVEEGICEKLEEASEAITDIVKIACEAREGFSRTVFEMDESSDLDRFFNDIRTEIEAIDDFPQQIEAPILKRIGMTMPVTSVVIYGPLTAPDLKVYAEQIKTRLQAIPSVTQVELSGFSDRQIRIELNAMTLRQFGLSTAEIAERIARQSVELPSGTIETDTADILIKFNDERRSPREFEDLIVVSSLTGAEIRLGDIAKIEDTFELEEEKIVFNNQPAALLTIFRTQADDTLRVIDTVTAFIKDERNRAPANVSVELTQDQSTLVRDRLNLLVKNGGVGLILVGITLWIFFGLRYSFWVAMGLPVSFGGSLFLMAAFGVTLNLITMVSLLVAVGVLMDDGIVIAENIAAHWARGKKPLEAAVDGTREVLPSVTSSFLTTAMIFGPLMFIAGDLGAVLRSFPIVLLMTISVSLIEAFIILPAHLNHSLKNEGKTSRIAQGAIWAWQFMFDVLLRPLINLLKKSTQDHIIAILATIKNFRPTFRQRFDMIRDTYVIPLVEKAVRLRYLTVGLVLATLVFSLSMLGLGFLKFEAFPDLDGNTVAARILLPQGTPLKRTEEIVGQIVAAADPINTRETPNQPGGQDLIQGVMTQFNLNTTASEVGPHVATVSIDLLSADLRTVTLDDFTNEWRTTIADIPDVLNISFGDFEVGPAGFAIELELSGSNLEDLQTASLELQNWLMSYAGAEDVMSDMRPGKPEMNVRLREGAMALGLDSRMIANQLRAAFYGTTASEIQVGSETFEIDVRLSPEDRNSFDDLEYFTVTAPNGAQVPLGTVAILEESRGFARIRRVNGLRTVSIKGNVDTAIGNAAEILNDTTSRFIPKLLEKYPSIQVNVEGETAEVAETGSSILRGFVMGLFGVFMLLSIQFRSYIEPIIVMLVIPTALIGVVWGHVILGLNLSMPSILGFVSLGGIVVNNSILMVTFIKIKGNEGHSIAEAAVEAARMRFRAMTLTSLTTLMGMLPIMLETSLQALILKPLIASLAFGILAASILVLFLVPAAYLIVEDIGYARFGANKATQGEDVATS